jgi:hypothetical protein
MTQRNKNILLVIGFLLLVVVAYNFAFSKTIDLKKRINTLEQKTESIESFALAAATLEKREKFADSVLNKNNIKNSSIQNNLLEFLNILSSDGNFTISDFNEPHTFSENGATITSYQFTLKGNYNEVLQVIYSLEQKYNFGRVVNVHFEKKRDYRKERDYLECSVIVESLFSE